MGKKLPHTPNSKIRHALRILWMRSRERTQALRNTNYCCAYCGKKQSSAKGKEVALDVHHIDGITNWEHIISVIRKELLVNPSRLAPVCKGCHDKLHQKETT